MRNLSYENEFCMLFHFHANQSHFHKNGFALRLALKQRRKGTRKLSIKCDIITRCQGRQKDLITKFFRVRMPRMPKALPFAKNPLSAPGRVRKEESLASHIWFSWVSGI